MEPADHLALGVSDRPAGRRQGARFDDLHLIRFPGERRLRAVEVRFSRLRQSHAGREGFGWPPSLPRSRLVGNERPGRRQNRGAPSWLQTRVPRRQRAPTANPAAPEQQRRVPAAYPTVPATQPTRLIVRRSMIGAPIPVHGSLHRCPASAFAKASADRPSFSGGWSAGPSEVRLKADTTYKFFPQADAVR